MKQRKATLKINKRPNNFCLKSEVPSCCVHMGLAVWNRFTTRKAVLVGILAGHYILLHRVLAIIVRNYRAKYGGHFPELYLPKTYSIIQKCSVLFLKFTIGTQWSFDEFQQWYNKHYDVCVHWPSFSKMKCY